MCRIWNVCFHPDGCGLQKYLFNRKYLSVDHLANVFQAFLFWNALDAKLCDSNVMTIHESKLGPSAAKIFHPAPTTACRCDSMCADTGAPLMHLMKLAMLDTRVPCLCNGCCCTSGSGLPSADGSTSGSDRVICSLKQSCHHHPPDHWHQNPISMV